MAALRAPKHAYGGPEPSGTGAGVVRWQRDASSLLFNHLRVEREKDWKRLRHRLIREGWVPLDAAELGSAERVEEIARTRMQVRFRKFWDLMNERDRPWHYDIVLQLCTAHSPYTCERYSDVTAATMQGILAQRAKAEKAVRDQRDVARELRRRLTVSTLQMLRTGRPVSSERMSQMRRLAAQVTTGGGGVAAVLRQLQHAAKVTYQDRDYIQHVESLLPLLEETARVGHMVQRDLLRAVEALQAETEAFQRAMEERRLARDQVLAALEEFQNRSTAGTAADDGVWPPLTDDYEVSWRYPPLEYWQQGQEQGQWQQQEYRQWQQQGQEQGQQFAAGGGRFEQRQVEEEDWEVNIEEDERQRASRGDGRGVGNRVVADGEEWGMELMAASFGEGGQQAQGRGRGEYGGGFAGGDEVGGAVVEGKGAVRVSNVHAAVLRAPWSPVDGGGRLLSGLFD